MAALKRGHAIENRVIERYLYSSDTSFIIKVYTGLHPALEANFEHIIFFCGEGKLSARSIIFVIQYMTLGVSYLEYKVRLLYYHTTYIGFTKTSPLAKLYMLLYRYS